MKSNIFLIDQDNKLTELSQTPYDSEELLQLLLADHPRLLQSTSSSDARLLLICRELGIPEEQAGGDRWALDHLFVDREGIPVLVEVKRANDTRSRREVVAQMLDYAANSVAYLPIDRIVSLFTRSAPSPDKDPNALSADFLDGGDSEVFWRQVEANLRAGRIRLVFVADRIPASLRRIVEFLNEQMRPAEVLALELEQFATSDGVRTLVPHLIGNTQRAEVAKSVQATPPPASETELLDGLGSDDSRKAANQLMDWLRQAGCEVRLIRGQKSILALVVSPGRGPVSVLSIDRAGKVWVGIDNWKAAAAFADEPSRLAVLQQLRTVPGLHLSATALDPGFPVVDLLRGDTWTGFKAVVNDVVTKLRAVPT